MSMVDLQMILRISAAFAALMLGSALHVGEAAAQYYPTPGPQYAPPAPPPYRGGPPIYQDDDMADEGPGPNRAAPPYPPGSYAARPQQTEPRYNGRPPDIADSSPYGGPPPDPYGPPRYASPAPYQAAPPYAAPPIYISPPGAAADPGYQEPPGLRPPGAVGSPLPGVAAPAQPLSRDTVATLPPDYQAESGEPKQLPSQFRRQMVDYRGSEPAGTIVIDTAHTFLYLALGNGKAMRYGIGVGREGFTWAGTERISRMQEWPDWHPPAEMIQRQPYLPRFMAGGEGNPLGARALYLGNTLYRIHGTNQPSTIGSFVSSGCIRLVNEDVEDLYSRVQVGTRVVVLPKSSASAAAVR
jgi:lipoprotein-anchoring transpeptidase ErfK/SrfK